LFNLGDCNFKFELHLEIIECAVSGVMKLKLFSVRLPKARLEFHIVLGLHSGAYMRVVVVLVTAHHYFFPFGMYEAANFQVQNSERAFENQRRGILGVFSSSTTVSNH
jgi:hypothetical protein